MPALDHVFVCCSVGGHEAAALARLGLAEGAPNTHPGQGTACRRFFFTNAYLELMWVADADEARGPLPAPTRLWERWSRRAVDACPFGLVLRPGDSGEAREPPFAAWAYHPRSTSRPTSPSTWPKARRWASPRSSIWASRGGRTRPRCNLAPIAPRWER